MIPLVKFNGYWLGEPGNVVALWVNLTHVKYVTPYGKKGQYAMVIAGDEPWFIMENDEVKIVDMSDEEDIAAEILRAVPEDQDAN